MEKRRILIADADEDYRKDFAGKLSQEPDLQMVGQTGDGMELLHLIESEKPDAVVMEMVLTGMDGIAVLEKLDGMPAQQRPCILVVTSLIKGGIASLAASKGVDHYMTKPCKTSTVLERIRQLCGAAHREGSREFRKNLEAIVTDILLEIGVPPQVSGYNYLREAIILAVNDMEVMRSVTKLLYPTVAKRFHSTSVRVERSIRHAIGQTWIQGDPSALQKYFGRSAANNKRKPTNSAFIARIADRLQLQLRIDDK